MLPLKKARPAGTGAPLGDGSGRGIHDPGVMAEAKVVVGADHDQTFAADLDLGSPGPGNGPKIGMDPLGRDHGL